MRSTVEENGFEFVEYSIKFFCINEGVYNGDLKKDTAREDLANYTKHFLKGGYFDGIITMLKPLIVFLDVSKIVFFPDLLKRNLKLAILCTKINLNKEPFIPPFTSTYIPRKRNLLTRTICEWLWLKALIAKKLRNLVTSQRNNGFSLYNLPFDYLKANGMTYLRRFIDCDRVTNFGLTHIPEIILSPPEFDYPDRVVKKNQFYMGLSVHLQRKEMIDEQLEVFLHKQHLVYCSMGMYDSKYALIRLSFINRLIRAFSSAPAYSILISSGHDIKIKQKDVTHENILIRQKLPQLEVLKHSRVMITHGGMQSLTEGIFCNVPLLVYPLNPNLDQKGNAARVKFHNIGIIGNIITDTPSEIIRKVNELLYRKDILQSTNEIRDRCIKSEHFKNGMNRLEGFIRKP